MADWLDIAVVGASLYGASQASKGATKAASASAGASDRAAQLTNQQYQQTRQDLAPWRAVGEDALYRQAASMGVIPTAPGVDRYAGFRSSPGYEFALEEGRKARETSAAQRGLLQSGQTLKGLEEYGQNVADQGYQNYLNNLGILSGTGQQATTATGQFGASAAGQQASALQQAGAARASGYLGQSQAIQQGLGDVAGYLGYRYA